MISSLPGRSFEGAEEEILVDGGGHFRLVIPDFRHVSFDATAAGRMDARKVLFHFEKTQHSIRVDLVLAPASVVHGRFVNGDGTPARIRETLLSRLSQVDRELDVPSGVAVASLKDEWDFRPGAIVPGEIGSTGVIHLDDDTWSIPVTSAWTRIALVARRTIVGWIEFEDKKVAPDPRSEVPLLVDPRLLPSSGEPRTVHVKIVDAVGQAVHCPAGSVYLEDDHSRPMSLLARRDDRLARDGEIDFLEVPFGTWSVQKQADGDKAFDEPEFKLDGERVHSDIEVRELGPRELPKCARLRISFTRGDGSPLFSKNSPTSSWPISEVRLYRRDRGEMRAATWIETADDPESSTKSLKVPRGEYIVVASSSAGEVGRGLANGWCKADLTAGDADVAIAFSAGAVVRIRAAPELKLPDEPIGFQLRILNEAGVPVVDWMDPEYGQGTGERETYIRLEAGRYRATVFLPQHDAASATFDAPADELVTIPMRLSRR
jgi:hypothetical protein